MLEVSGFCQECGSSVAKDKGLMRKIYYGMFKNKYKLPNAYYGMLCMECNNVENWLLVETKARLYLEALGDKFVEIQRG